MANGLAPHELRRSLGTVSASSVVITAMVGAGIFTTTGLMLARLESGWLVLVCWILGGTVALAGALSYAELATMMPEAGAEYVYLREIYGRPVAFLTGWTSFFVGFSAPIAASAVACVAYLASAGLLPNTWIAEKGTAATIVVLLTLVHYTGVRRGAAIQNLFAVFNVLALIGIVLWGFFGGRGSWQFLRSPTDFWNAGHASQIGLALLWVMFAYSGWNSSSYLAEEVRQPARTLPRSLFLGTLAVTALYVATNLFFFHAAPSAEIRGRITVGEVAVRHAMGPQAATGLAVVVSVLLLAAISAFLFIGPRVYFAMARDGLFFRFAARIHPRYRTPGLAIATQGVCAVLMILTGTFEQLLTYIGFALGIFPWLAVAGVILLRRRQPGRKRPYHVPGYPLVPLYYLLATAYILGAALVARPLPSLLAILTVAAGLPMFWVTQRQKKGESVAKVAGLGEP